jgi:hypothetical protein
MSYSAELWAKIANFSLWMMILLVCMSRNCETRKLHNISHFSLLVSLMRLAMIFLQEASLIFHKILAIVKRDSMSTLNLTLFSAPSGLVCFLIVHNMYMTCIQHSHKYIYFIKHNCTFNRLDEICCTPDPYVWYRHSWKCLNSVKVCEPILYFSADTEKFLLADWTWKIHKKSCQPIGNKESCWADCLTPNRAAIHINWRCRAARSYIWLLRQPIGEREALRHATATVGSSRPTLRKS